MCGAMACGTLPSSGRGYSALIDLDRDSPVCYVPLKLSRTPCWRSTVLWVCICYQIANSFCRSMQLCACSLCEYCLCTP